MTTHRRLQAVATQLQQPARAVDSPYLTSEEAMHYLKLGSLSALYAHIRENRLPVCRVGRHLRFDKRELDAWVRNELHVVPSRRSVPR